MDVRVRLWREHMASFLGPESPLTPEQQIFVREYHDALPAILTDPVNKHALRMLPVTIIVPG